MKSIDLIDFFCMWTDNQKTATSNSKLFHKVYGQAYPGTSKAALELRGYLRAAVSLNIAKNTSLHF